MWYTCANRIAAAAAVILCTCSTMSEARPAEKGSKEIVNDVQPTNDYSVANSMVCDSASKVEGYVIPLNPHCSPPPLSHNTPPRNSTLLHFPPYNFIFLSADGRRIIRCHVAHRFLIPLYHCTANAGQHTYHHQGVVHSQHVSHLCN